MYPIDAEVDNHSAQVITVESLGKGAWAILTATVLVSMFALALAFRSEMRSQIAEREARVAQDAVTHMQIELAAKGVVIKVDGH